VSRKSSDLIIVTALAFVAAVVNLAGVSSVTLRLPFAILLVFVLPGYAITAAIFGNLPSLEQWLFTLGLSLVTAVLSGFVLDWTPQGLQAQTWAGWLALVTMVGSLVAFVRRPATRLAPARLWAGLSIVDALLFGLAIVVVVETVILTGSVAAKNPSPDVVQLWMVPDNNANPQNVLVGVDNKTTSSATYRLQIQQGSHVLYDWRSLNVAAGGTLQVAVTLYGINPNGGPLEATLYRADAPNTPYRHVMFWLSSVPTSTPAQ